MIAPNLTGERVTLRHQQKADFDAFWAFAQSPRACYVDPITSRLDAWHKFSAETGYWSLCGMGTWSVEVKGSLAGQVSTMQPPNFPEVEIGWIVYSGFEGQGLAYEAAELALAYTWEHIRPASLVSYIDPDNDRSIKLATKLGATHDPRARRPEGEAPEETVVFRHRRPS